MTRLRIRGPAGQQSINLPLEATVNDLQAKITETTGLTVFDIKYNYPPIPLELGAHKSTTRLVDLDIKLDGQQLIAAQKAGSANAAGSQVLPSATGSTQNKSDANSPDQRSSSIRPPAGLPPSSLSRQPKNPEQDAPEVSIPSHAATMVLRIMPDDNSCLFRAFNTAFFGAMDNMTELRSIIAQSIQADPETYSEAVLDQKPDDYCVWIQTEEAWGGAIELDILSRHFDIEICSIDVQSLRIDRFNENSRQRCILVYSGIHYDACALSPSSYHNMSPDNDIKVFDTADEGILQAAVQLCQILKSRHYFTDTARFTVKCNICGSQMTGEKGATEHAIQTGHMDFGEAR